MITSRLPTVTACGATIRPPFESAANSVTARSISAAVCTPSGIILTPNDGAAASAARRNPMFTGVSGCRTNPTRLILGAISLNSSSHFPPIAGSKTEKPVRFPLGRAIVATKPLPTGSPTSTNTIGMVSVSCCKCRHQIGARHDYVRCHGDEFFSESPRLVGVGTSPTSVDLDIAAFRPTEFLEAQLERGSAGLTFNVAFGIPHQQTDPPHAHAHQMATPRPRRREAR